MGRPDWFENLYEKFAYDHGFPWYRLLFFRLIIDPLDDIFSWWYRKVTSPWHDAKNAYMRVKYGVDWSDVWNMNDWFINGAIAILERWLDKEGPMGTPVLDLDGTQMEHDDWVGILNEMLEGFKLWKTYEGGGGFPKVEPQIYDSGTHRNSRCVFSGEPEQSCYSDGAHYMTFDGVWHKCSMTTEEEKKYQRALDLFAKYHATLWD